MVVMMVAACGSSKRAATSADGQWRGVLMSPGGELPFGLVIGPSSYIVNGAERAPIEGVSRDGNKLVLSFDRYDATIEATLSADGKTMKGVWRKTSGKAKQSTLQFRATRGVSYRFKPEAAKHDPAIAGSWAMTFTDKDGDYRGVAKLVAKGGEVSGTIMTATGDYRYLQGQASKGDLRLSTFDGAHAFLFRAIRHADGSLRGDFWSRDVYHAAFVARRDADAVAKTMPDPYTQVRVTNADGRVRFSFPDADGKQLASTDARFRGKVVLVDVFGTWCPNCNDMAPLLRRWHAKYHARGLEIVGIAFEVTGDPARDRKQLAVYKKHHRLPFPLLLGGVSDKKQAGKAMSDLSAVKSYPTTIFIARDGKVADIHSGFAGPATGEHHTRMVAKMEAIIERLLAAAP